MTLSWFVFSSVFVGITQGLKCKSTRMGFAKQKTLATGFQPVSHRQDADATKKAVPLSVRDLLVSKTWTLIYCTVILRGFTCSAFGRVSVTTPWSILALIFPVLIDGSSSNERRKFSGR